MQQKKTNAATSVPEMPSENTAPSPKKEQAQQHAHAAAEPQSAANDAPDEEGSSFSVRDRRFWANNAENSNTNDSAEDTENPKKPSYVLTLETALQEKEERLKATLAQYKEAKDEFEAAKIRIRRDIQKEIESGKRNILNELLEVLDNLERAIQAPNAEQQTQELLAGVKMVYEQFITTLRNMGVEKVDALHQPFDPMRFEAISTIPVTDKEQDNRVLGIIKPCYLLGTEVLRVGTVAVGKLSS
jgi:molecular chaperone GrpE